MKIVANLQDLENTGIYIIKNTINNKFYIGSASVKLRLRINHHISSLKRGEHKNIKLQRAYNKYGENSFVIEILEICNENILEREQHYLDGMEAVEKGYNINPLATGILTMSKEVIIKRTKSFKKVMEQSSKYYKCIKEGTMLLEQVPDKYYKIISSYINKKPWNKGKQYVSTDHLKVPKKNKGDRTKDIETKRNKCFNIKVFDSNKVLLGEWRSAKDLEEESKKADFRLSNFMILRNKKGRNGYSPYFLSSININKSCKTQKPYKGLYFEFYSPSL